MSIVAVIPLLVLGGQGKEGAAERLFRASEKKIGDAKSLSCTLVGSGAASYRIEILMQKPRSFRELGTGVDIYCDGTTQINHIVDEKTFFRTDVSKSRFAPPGTCIDTFFGYSTGATAPYFTASTTFRMGRADGRKCAVKTTVFKSFGRGDHMTYYVDAQTKLPIGFDQEFGGTKMQFRIKNLVLNAPVPAGSFSWKPGPGVTEKKISR